MPNIGETNREPLSNGFNPRHYQWPCVDALSDAIRRFFLAWHRRAGKDALGMSIIWDQSQVVPANYWHCYPKHVQARRAIWNGIDKRTGVRFIHQAFPPEEYDGKPNDQDMLIRFKNGATYQLFGSDYYDRAVGADPAGILLSEWALCAPAAWDFFRPILAENGGWAGFITTFRGVNHAWQMWERVKELPEWYTSLCTVLDTFRHDGTPVVTLEAIKRDIAEGMSMELVLQEYFCDPTAPREGAIYGRQLLDVLGLESRSYEHVAELFA